MNCDQLEEKTKRIASRIEAYAQLLELAPSDRQSILLDELRRDLHELSVAILELPSESDRNNLWDQIIHALQNGGMIASAVKVLVDIFKS
jgi:hypothetical protein